MPLLSRYDIFISYARADAQGYVEKLSAFLSSLDYSCFIDKAEVPAGSRLTRSLKSALGSSTTFVIVVTPAALGRPYVALELSTFAATGRPIIPINVDSALSPTVLRTVPWSVIQDRDIVWIDESAGALTACLPSPHVYEGIQNLFGFTRRNVKRRRLISAALTVILLAVLAAAWQARNARIQQTIAEAKTLELTRSAAALRDEQARLTEANSILAAQRTELIAKTAEAGAAAARATRQEAQARANAVRAKEQELAAESLALAARGSREALEDPLAGLAFAILAVQKLPRAQGVASQSVRRTLKQLMHDGRVARLAVDFQRPYFVDDPAPFFLLARPDGRSSQLRDLRTGALISGLPGAISEVITTRESRTWGELTVLPFFLVHYRDAPSELRRTTDGEVVLRGAISSFGYAYRAGEPYFQVWTGKHDGASGLLGATTGRPHIALAKIADSFEFVPNAEAFAVSYKDGTAELRRVSTGGVMVDADNPGGAKAVTQRVSLSADGSILAVVRERELFQYEAAAYQVGTEGPIAFPDQALTIQFDRATPRYVVAYRTAPGEVRRADSASVLALRGPVREATFGSKGELAVAYADSSCDFFARDGLLVDTLRPCSSLFWDPRMSMFRAQLGDHRAFVTAGGRRLPIDGDVTYSEDGGNYYIDNYRKLRALDGGEAVRLPFETDRIFFIRGTRFALINELGGQSALFDTGSGVLTSIGEVFSGSQLSGPYVSPRGRYLVTGARSPANALSSQLIELSGPRVLRRLPALKLVGGIFFSGSDEYAVALFEKGGGELYESATGRTITALSGALTKATFSADSRLVWLEYAAGQGEVRWSDTGAVIVPAVSNVKFDGTGRAMVITFDNNRSELWSSAVSPRRLAEMDVGLVGVRFNDRAGRLLAWYSDRRAYLLDIGWLEDVSAAQLDGVEAGELTRLACVAFESLGSEAAGVFERPDLSGLRCRAR
jgi:hypothetical protein